MRDYRNVKIICEYTGFGDPLLARIESQELNHITKITDRLVFELLFSYTPYTSIPDSGNPKVVFNDVTVAIYTRNYIRYMLVANTCMNAYPLGVE